MNFSSGLRVSGALLHPDEVTVNAILFYTETGDAIEFSFDAKSFEGLKKRSLL